MFIDVFVRQVSECEWEWHTVEEDVRFGYRIIPREGSIYWLLFFRIQNTYAIRRVVTWRLRNTVGSPHRDFLRSLSHLTFRIARLEVRPVNQQVQQTRLSTGYYVSYNQVSVSTHHRIQSSWVFLVLTLHSLSFIPLVHIPIEFHPCLTFLSTQGTLVSGFP